MKRNLFARTILALGLVVAMATSAKADVVINLTGPYAGSSWANALVAYNPGDLIGTLTGASIDAQFGGDGTGSYWASDIGVAAGIGASMPFTAGNGSFQIGGFNNGTGGAPAEFVQNWGENANHGGNTSSAFNMVTTVNLATPVTFNGNGADPTVFYGNFYVGGNTETPSWNGTITLHGVSVVPEPSSLVVLGLGLVGLVGRRRRA